MGKQGYRYTKGGEWQYEGESMRLNEDGISQGEDGM